MILLLVLKILTKVIQFIELLFNLSESTASPSWRGFAISRGFGTGSALF